MSDNSQTKTPAQGAAPVETDENAVELLRGKIARAIYDVSNRWIEGNFSEGHQFRDFSQVDERTCNLHFDYADAILELLPKSVWRSSAATEAVIAGLNKQLTEQFELSSKYVRLWSQGQEALRAFVTAYGSQESFTAGLDAASCLAKAIIAAADFPAQPQEAPDKRAIADAYSDWAWEKEDTAVGLMLPNESARAGFFAGVDWCLKREKKA